MSSGNHSVPRRVKRKLSRARLASRKAAVRETVYRLRPAHSQRVVFATGVQRVGSNMFMDVLDQSVHTAVFHDSDPRAFDHYEMRALSVISELVRSQRVPVVVVKALCECQDIGRLLASLGGSRAIWLLRNYDDVVRSQVRRWSSLSKSVAMLAADPHDPDGWRGRGMSAETLKLLREFWHPGLSSESACALFWYLRNVLYFEQALDRDSRVKLVRYEDVVSAPDSTLAPLFGWLGLTYKPAFARFVHDRSRAGDPCPAIEAPIRDLCDRLTRRFGRQACDIAHEL